MSARRVAGWLAVVGLLELVTRMIVYGLAPSPIAQARSLGGQLGGPGFTAVVLIALVLGVAGSATLVWLASLGVRERWALAEDRPSGPPPHIALRPLLLRAAALTLAGWLVFAGVESVVHMEAGLGFHGLQCLVGPVHRDALPIVAGLALIASALLAAGAHLLAWMRRTVGRFGRPRVVAHAGLALGALAPLLVARRTPRLRGTPPRGPPLLAV